MSEIRFHVSGRTAREVAAKMGALIEGEFARRPDVQEKDGAVTLSVPAALFVAENQAAHKGLHDKISRLLGIPAWEVRNGVVVTVRAGDDKGPGQRADEMQTAALIELASRK